MLSSISRNCPSWIAGSATVAGAALAVIGGLALGHILGTIGSTTATALLASGAGAACIGTIALIYLRYRSTAPTSVQVDNPSQSVDFSKIPEDFVLTENSIPNLDLNARDDQGRTYLHLAALRQRIPHIHGLLKRGANVNAKDNAGRTPIHIAAAQGNDVALTHLLVKDPSEINAVDNCNETALALLVRTGPTDINALVCIRLLANNGADFTLVAWHNDKLEEIVSAEVKNHVVSIMPTFFAKIWPEPESISESQKGETPLNLTQERLFAAAKGGSEYAVRRILTSTLSYDINAKNALGCTALHLAAMNGHSNIVQILLENGANPNIKADGDGNTALHYAIKPQNVETVKLLLNHPKIDATLMNKEGSNPLHFVAEEARDLQTQTKSSNSAHYVNLGLIATRLKAKGVSTNVSNIKGTLACLIVGADNPLYKILLN